MGAVRIRVRIDEGPKRFVKEHCKRQGIPISQFVREALLDRLEGLEDTLGKIRREPTRPRAEVLAEL